MSRTAFTALALIVVACPATWAQPKADPVGQLKKAMPKDQLAAVEKLQKVQVLANSYDKETNGLRQKELLEQINGIRTELHKSLVAQIEADGLKDWVGACDVRYTDFVRLEVPGLLRISIKFSGMGDEQKKMIRDLKQGEPVRVTLGPDGQAGQGLGHDAGLLTVHYGGARLAKVEKLK